MTFSDPFQPIRVNSGFVGPYVKAVQKMNDNDIGALLVMDKIRLDLVRVQADPGWC